MIDGKRRTAAGTKLAAVAVLAVAGLAAGCSSSGASPSVTSASPSVASPSAASSPGTGDTDPSVSGPGTETPGPDTDPLSGRVTPELVGIDPCAILTGDEVGMVTGDAATAGTEVDELRTDQRVCAWPGLTVIVAARATSLSETLESRITVDTIEDLLGLPLPGLLAVSVEGEGDGALRIAQGLSLSFGGGFQLALVPTTPIEIGTDTWEAFLELARVAAPRVPL